MGVIFETHLAFAKKGNSKKYMIELCCTWGDALDDNTLKFSIKNGDSKLNKIVKSSINYWEKLFDGSLKFKYVKDASDADIKIKFNKGKGIHVGKTVTYFDNRGFIKFAEVYISKGSPNVVLTSMVMEHVIKHELGHTLGLGHANFKNTLMSTKIENVITHVSPCELESAKFANHWKFIDNNDSPVHVQKNYFSCKKGG